MMLPAGDTTEDMFEQLLGVLEPGDTIVDGGNTNYQGHAQAAPSRPCAMACTTWTWASAAACGGSRSATA